MLLANNSHVEPPKFCAKVKGTFDYMIKNDRNV